MESEKAFQDWYKKPRNNVNLVVAKGKTVSVTTRSDYSGADQDKSNMSMSGSVYSGANKKALPGYNKLLNYKKSNNSQYQSDGTSDISGQNSNLSSNQGMGKMPPNM